MQQKESTQKHHNQYTPKDELVKNQKSHTKNMSQTQKSDQQSKMDQGSKKMQDQKISKK